MDQNLLDEVLKKIELQEKQIKKLFFLNQKNTLDLENLKQKKGMWKIGKCWVEKV